MIVQQSQAFESFWSILKCRRTHTKDLRSFAPTARKFQNFRFYVKPFPVLEFLKVLFLEPLDFKIGKFQPSENAEMAVFKLLEPRKLISRKI